MGGKRPKFQVDVVTLFPLMFEGPLNESLMGRAQKAGILKIGIHDLRKWTGDVRHQKVDDRSFGGGAGMVIQPEPIFKAIKDLSNKKSGVKKPWVIYLSPQGSTLSQPKAEKLKKKRHLILICGHYEGIDERAMEWIDEEISIGDFVLTGGELPAMVLLDTVARLVPGVVGDPDSLVNESFSKGLLDYPHYTRPRRFKGKAVPEVLLSGNHKNIESWRRRKAIEQTRKKRPDLLNAAKNKFG